MKALYWLVGMYPTRDGHMEEAVPSFIPTPRKREAIRQGNAFLRTDDAALKYAHLWIVRIDETARETGVALVK